MREIVGVGKAEAGNTAVKRRVRARGLILAGRAPFSCAKCHRKTWKTAPVLKYKRTKIETYIVICRRNKSRENENSTIFEHETYWSTGILLITVAKHLDSLACKTVYNSFLTALHVVITTCEHAQTLDRFVEASGPRRLQLLGRRLQITPACLQVNARATFRVFAFSLVFADERLEQAKREEVRRKEEKSRSGRVVE